MFTKRWLATCAAAVLLIGRTDSQYYMYNPNARSIDDGSPLSADLLPRQRHYGQPIPSASIEDPADVWEMTPEDREAKKRNPLPYIINPAIRRGTQSLGHLEAHANRDSRRKALLMPILNLVLNPSRR